MVPAELAGISGPCPCCGEITPSPAGVLSRSTAPNLPAGRGLPDAAAPRRSENAPSVPDSRIGPLKCRRIPPSKSYRADDTWKNAYRERRRRWKKERERVRRIENVLEARWVRGVRTAFILLASIAIVAVPAAMYFDNWGRPDPPASESRAAGLEGKHAAVAEDEKGGRDHAISLEPAGR